MPDIITFLGKIIIALFILGIIVFAVILVVMGIAFSHAKEDSMRADYSYDLSISTSKPLYNTTLLIPIPCGYDNKSGEFYTFLNLSEISHHNFDTANISMQIDDREGYRFLNISAQSMLPLYKNHIDPIPIYPGQNESELPPTPATVYSSSYSPETPDLLGMGIHAYFMTKDDEIDTKNPFEKEQLMRPFTVLNSSGKDNGFFSKDYFSGKISDQYSESVIEVPVYLSYETETDTNVAISCTLRGANEWWSGGWQWNEYEQRIGNEFKGPKNGSYILEGDLVTGKGVY